MLSDLAWNKTENVEGDQFHHPGTGVSVRKIEILYHIAKVTHR